MSWSRWQVPAAAGSDALGTHLYLSSSLNSVSAWFLSRARVTNWFSTGGTCRQERHAQHTARSASINLSHTRPLGNCHMVSISQTSQRKTFSSCHADNQSVGPVFRRPLLPSGQQTPCMYPIPATPHRATASMGPPYQLPTHLEAHGEHAALALDADILGPLDKAAQVTLGSRGAAQACAEQHSSSTCSNRGSDHAQAPKVQLAVYPACLSYWFPAVCKDEPQETGPQVPSSLRDERRAAPCHTLQPVTLSGTFLAESAAAALTARPPTHPHSGLLHARIYPKYTAGAGCVQMRTSIQDCSTLHCCCWPKTAPPAVHCTLNLIPFTDCNTPYGNLYADWQSLLALWTVARTPWLWLGTATAVAALWALPATTCTAMRKCCIRQLSSALRN